MEHELWYKVMQSMSEDGNADKGKLPSYFMYVARFVKQYEVLREPKAEAACKKEWDMLEAIRCWDFTGIRP